MDALSAVRQELKAWESQFISKNGRKPGKNDIQKAADSTRALYKKYQKLRTDVVPSKRSLPHLHGPQSTPDTNNPWDSRIEPDVVETTPVIDPTFSIKEKIKAHRRMEVKKVSEVVPSESLKISTQNELNVEKCIDVENQKPINQSDHTNNVARDSMALPIQDPLPLSTVASNSTISKSRLFSPKINIRANEAIGNRKVSKQGSLLGRSINIDFSENLEPKSKKHKIDPITSSSETSKQYCRASIKPQTKVMSSLSTNSTVNNIDNNSQTNNISKQVITENSVTMNKTILCESNVEETSQPTKSKHKSHISKRSISSSSKTTSEPVAVRKSSVDDNNYVRINLRVKRFSRKGASRQKFLRNQIRKTKFTRRMTTQACFNCNQIGHWANKCPLRFSKEKPSSSENKNDEFHEIPIPVTRNDFRLVDIKSLEESCVRQQPEELDDVVAISNLNTNETNIDSSCVVNTLHQLGFSEFRPGQEAVVNRIVGGQSTLLMMPTGGGKSLCYQLPALLHQRKSGSIALVICPLISLMQDQIARLPPAIKGAALNSTLSYTQRDEVLAEARRGELAFIMVSPEALVDRGFLKPSSLPSISFVCIDEAHCLADWSHHFRPSYLRVCKLLRTRFAVTCFLGLSATCTNGTLVRICRHLDIKDPTEGCIRSEPLPTNLTITVSRDLIRDEAILSLLTKPPFSQSRSILIYCSTRDQTTRVASLIRTSLQDQQPVKSGRRKLDWKADSYHAGLSLAQRARLQKRFMQGSLRILAATVAFGMGLDKPDLHAVIHYSRPTSFENYVQEIGRAGRDGKPANCHVFLPPEIGEDLKEANDLQRHVYANHVDFPALKRLVRMLFPACNCPVGACSGHLRALASEKSVQELDIREETLSTLMCYLELHPLHYLKIVRSRYQRCSLLCYRGPKQLAELSQKCLAVAGALSLADERDQWQPTLDRSVDIDMVELADRFGWDIDGVKQEIAGLEWTKDAVEGARKTGVMPEFKDFGWMYWAAKCNFSPTELDSIVSYLFSRVTRLENSGIANMHKLTTVLNATALKGVDTIDFESEEVADGSKLARQAIARHFSEDILDCAEDTETSPEPISSRQESNARSTIRSFIHIYQGDHQLTGRSIACVLHGISTPCYPAIVWGRVRRFWRSLLEFDWPTIYRLANEEIRLTVT